MVKRTTILIFLLLAMCGTAPAQESGFAGLVSSLKSKDDTRALMQAQNLEKAGENSFGLYYNKGLAERNLGQFARARASFEKALTYSPRDLETRRRLREVKEKLNPQIAKYDVEGTPPWSRSEAEIALAVPTLALLAFGVLGLLGKKVPRGRVAVPAVLLLLVLTLIFLNNPPAQRAVLVSPNAKLLSQPESESSGEAITEGILVEVLERKSHFVEVKTGEGKCGWLRQGELVEL